MKLSLEDRDAIVKLIKTIAKDNAQRMGDRSNSRKPRSAGSITRSKSSRSSSSSPASNFSAPHAFSGTNGVCLEEFAPFGVIGIVTPVTHSVPTLSANAINMIASGNSIVANAHPSGVELRGHRGARIQPADRREIRHRKPDHRCVIPPTLETADAMFNHRGDFAPGGDRRPGRGPCGARRPQARDRRGARQSAGGCR